MMNGNGSAPPEPAPTGESLQAELARARQLIQLFRQQRDQAATLCNDLQVELAMTRQELAAAQQQRADEIEGCNDVAAALAEGHP